MAVDIINPNYWISELFGSILIFALFLALMFVWFAAKRKLPFQWVVGILTLGFLMLPIVFDGFLSWVPLIIIIVGIIAGAVFNRFMERT